MKVAAAKRYWPRAEQPPNLAERFSMFDYAAKKCLPAVRPVNRADLPPMPVATITSLTATQCGRR